MTEPKFAEDSIAHNPGVDVDDNTTSSTCREKARLLYRGLALAPMVRASTTPLRILALQYGADFTYTEELIDRSLSQTIRVENKDLKTIDYVKDPATLSKKTRKKLKADKNRPCLILRIDPNIEKGKLICQLGTGEPELALEAAKRVVGDVDAIDINMGCPKKFSVSGGMGSALLKDPDRAARILKVLKKELLGPLGKPLSCKIRLLETTQETVEFVERMIRAGADAVAIHARRIGHEPTVAADWNSLEEVLSVLRTKYPNFNFLINGDFYDRKERAEFVERTKVDGVLLGRPALYNTSTFLPLSSATSLLDKTAVVQEYIRQSVRYDSHHKNTKYVVCEMMSHRRTPTGRVPYLCMKFPLGQTVQKTCNCHDLPSLCQVWNIDHSEAKSLSASSTNGIHKFTGKTYSNTTATLAAGEHRYEDSYFLEREEGNADNMCKATENKETKTGEIHLGAQTQTNTKRSSRGQDDVKNYHVGNDDIETQNRFKRTRILQQGENLPSI